MNFKYYIIILIATLTVGCHSDKKQLVKDLNGLVLKQEVVALSTTLMNPSKIAVIDSFLVINDKSSDGTKLALIANLNSNSCFPFATKGEAPGELLYVAELNVNQAERTIGTYDYIKRDYNIFKIDSLIENRNYLPIQISFKSITAGIPIRVIATNKGRFVSTGSFDKGIVGIINIKDSSLIMKGSKPVDFEKEGFHTINRAFAYRPTYNPINNRTALLALYSDQYIVYDSLFNKISEIRSEGGINPIYEIINDGGSQMVRVSRKSINNYSQIASTLKYVYGIYSGKDDTDLGKQSVYRELNEIHVFDWDGKLVKKYMLDSPIVSFTVDSEDLYIYGISHINEEPRIVRFKML